MPSTSPKQQKFMQAVGHDPKFAAKVGVPQSVGMDFAAADKAAAPFPPKKKKKPPGVAVASHTRKPPMPSGPKYMADSGSLTRRQPVSRNKAGY